MGVNLSLFGLIIAIEAPLIGVIIDHTKAQAGYLGVFLK